MTEMRMYAIGITSRLHMAFVLFFNVFRMLLFGEVVLRFNRLGDERDE